MQAWTGHGGAESLSLNFIWTNLSQGNFFPAHAGLITACLVGSFDASSGDFAILARLDQIIRIQGLFFFFVRKLQICGDGSSWFLSIFSCFFLVFEACNVLIAMNYNSLRSMIDTGLSFGTAFRLLALMTATCWLTTFAWPDSPVESAKARHGGYHYQI